MKKPSPRLAHARDRAMERYGIELSDDDLLGLETQISGGKGVLIRRSGAREIIMLKVAQAVVIAVFDPMSRHIITFLRADQIRRYLTPQNRKMRQ